MKASPDLPDKALVDLTREGDERAFEIIVRRHTSLLKGVATKILHDTPEADDVVQDTFIQAYNKLDGYDPEKGHFLGWLITIARCRAIDVARRRSSYMAMCDRYEKSILLESFQSGNNAVPNVIDQNNLCEQIDLLLEGLPEGQAEVLRLTYYDGMSQRQIAEHLDMSLGTVKTRMELGISKLATKLHVSRKSSPVKSDAKLTALEDLEDMDLEILAEDGPD